MKNWKLFISALLFTCFFVISCATSTVNEQKKNSAAEDDFTTEEINEPAPTPEELFITSLENVNIQFTKIPPKTKKGKDFSSAYEILVSNNIGEAISDFEVTLTVPEKKEGTQISFSKINVKSDANGIITYMPPTPAFAAGTKLTASPSIPSELVIEDTQLEPFTASADYICESDVSTKGAIMFVFEYTESGRPSKNSYDILSGLRKRGVTQIGNAPISDDTSYITASKEKIYKANFEYVGTDFGYLIGGTIKFANPVEKNEDDTYTAHMIADIYGIEMKTGKVIYEQTIEYTSSGANWNKAVDNCKTKLTAMTVDSIMLGL